jgi:hypothetical protein
MDSESSNIDTTAGQASRRFDWVSAVLALGTLLLVGWTAWLRFGPASAPEPPAVGSVLPPLRLIDMETSEPLVLLGLKGKVVWIVFWSAGTPSGRASLPKLEAVWKRLKPYQRFTLVAASVDSEQAERVRAVIAQVHATLPVYLAGPETCRRFGAQKADPPLHVLIDAQGQIAALARGAGQETIDRLASQAQGWLDELDPLRNTRFARVRPNPGCERTHGRDTRQYDDLSLLHQSTLQESFTNPL